MDSHLRKHRPPQDKSEVTSRAAVRKSAVVIAGMHRSGTSAMARTLSLLGCTLPQTLLKPHRDNERGYWESQAVRNLNDDILASAGSTWDDWEPVNPAWFRSPLATDFRDRAIEVLSSEFGNATLFVLKDPRISRLLPFWIDTLEGFGATTLIVCPLRNPLEVAASLEARDQIDPSISHLLWLRHLLDAEGASRGLKRAYVRYDDLVECWQGAADRLSESLGIGWPRLSRGAELEIEEFLEHKLRHQVSEDASLMKNSGISRWIRSTFEILNRWSKDDVRETDMAELERIKADFDNATIAFRHPVAVGREAVQAEKERTSKLIEEVQVRQAKLDKLRIKIEQMSSQLLMAQEKLRTMDKVAAENEKVMADLIELSDSKSAALKDKCAAYAALEAIIVARR